MTVGTAKEPFGVSGEGFNVQIYKYHSYGTHCTTVLQRCFLTLFATPQKKDYEKVLLKGFLIKGQFYSKKKCDSPHRQYFIDTGVSGSNSDVRIFQSKGCAHWMSQVRANCKLAILKAVRQESESQDSAVNYQTHKFDFKTLHSLNRALKNFIDDPQT